LGRRRILVSLGLLVLAGLSVLVAPSSSAQVLPDLPPLPPPPADGNPLADVLGPASATVCDATAVVFGLAGPIASAQLPPELQSLLAEADPYLALVTYACGLIAVPPSGVVCASDASATQLTGLLGSPVGLPAASQIFYDTAAGIEHALLRIGFDVGSQASQAIAQVLGCGVPKPAGSEPPAALPTPTTGAPADTIVAPASDGVVPVGIPAVTPPATGPAETVVTPGQIGTLGALRYPVREAAALLLALPLALLAAAVALGPRLAPHPRRRRRAAEVDGTAGPASGGAP
jgi:hypothetical protein